jgi:hypothetical protein
MPPPSDPRNLRAKWQRALEERRKAAPAPEPEKLEPAAPAAEIEKRARPAARPRPPQGAAKPPEMRVAPRDDAGDFPRPVAKPGSAKNETEEAANKAEGPGSRWSSAVAVMVLVGGVTFGLRTLLATPPTPPPPEEDPVSSATASDPVLPPSASARPPQPPRCTAAAGAPFVVGDAPAPRPSSSAPDSDDAPDDDLAPFAVELGRGVRFGGGFAVGTQRQAEGGTISMVATVGADGNQGKLVRLARSRGDFDPPVVTAAGSSILAAMMEPNAAGRAIRIAKIDGDRVTWGPELSEGNDESFAVDIATAGTRALVVWDDVPVGHERSVVELATFDTASMLGSGARAITPSTIDADGPRLAARPGGFWLSYLVHGDPPTEPTAAKDDAPEDAGPGKSAKKGASNNPDDSDTEAAGEAIAHQWIELIPLDESGSAAGAARAVTPKNSRVIAYDLDDGEDGRALLIYREDDTPSGSSGGRVKVVIAELGGIGEPRVIAEEGVGAGVPQLHGGWVVIHSLSGPVQLGAIGPRGDLVGELAPEPVLKQGEILAAEGGTFLVATPAGRAMKLGVVRCTR